MNAHHLKTETRNNERVKSFLVPNPDNPKLWFGVTVNERIDDGHVEMAIAASDQEQFDANHARYVEQHLDDAG